MSKIVVSIPKDEFTEDELTRDIKSGKIPHNAISWAAENNYIELTKALIDMGADVKENYNYPLELASRNGNTEIVRLLLKAGARTSDSEDDEGYCLRMAADRGHIEIVKLLLDSGANPKADKCFALKLALNAQHMDIVELLLNYVR